VQTFEKQSKEKFAYEIVLFLQLLPLRLNANALQATSISNKNCHVCFAIG